MICWAVKKILPLYAGNDLALFNQTIKNHLKNCAKCNALYQRYSLNVSMLHKLQKPSIPEKTFNGYWEQIYAQINVESQHREQSPQKLSNGFFSSSPWKHALAFGCALLVGFFIFVKELDVFTTFKQDPYLESEYSFPRMPANLAPISLPDSSKISIKLPKSIGMPEILLNHADGKDVTEYELELVQPLNVNNASF